MTRTGKSIALIPILLVGLGLVLPAGTQAKFTCGERPPASDIPLVGLPAEPEAGRSYSVLADLPRAHAANPHAVLMMARCPRGEGAPAADGVGSRPLNGTEAGQAGYRFEVRFPVPGRWLIVSMDRGGHFRDHGFHPVSATGPSASSGDGRGMPAAALIAGGALVAGTGLALARRRRRS